MGLSVAEIEELTAFVQRYCAVETSNGEEPSAGYFALKQGKNQRGASKARAPVKWGPLDTTAPEVLRRVRELASNGNGNVYVAAYGEADSSPIEVCTVKGTTEELDAVAEEGPTDGSAIAALTHCLVKTNSMLVAENREWRDRTFRQLDVALEDRERMTALAYHSALMEQGAGDERMAQALQAIAPSLERIAPQVVEAVLRYASGGSGAGAGAELPADPGGRIEALIGRMTAAATDLGAVAVANPTEVTPARAAPLYELIRQLAGPLGLNVTGYPGAVA